MNKQLIRLSAVMTFLSFAVMFNAVGQEKVWSIGPEVGLSLSKYGGDGAGTNDFKSGAIGGLFVTYSIQNTFAITTKLLYSQKGAAFSPGDTKQTLNYIEVPVIGRFFLNKEGKFRPNIFVGPSFGFLTGATNKVGSNDRVKIDNYENIFNTFDFGVTGGMGFNFLIAPDTYFIIDARYTQGVSNISRSTPEVHNNSLGFTAGLSFGF